MRDYVAIFDIGSNAVRLVIYDAPDRAPVKIHNERSLCRLGAGLAETGHLNPAGVRAARDSLRRFAGLVAALRIRHVYAVATAAVRDAVDGAAFIASLKADFGLDVQVIDGRQEALLSAQGVLAGGLGQNGVIGDYGGGSLELIRMAQGKMRQRLSLPIGSHRLLALKDRAARMDFVAAHLDRADFLQNCQGQDLYVLGGAWRAMALAHMHMKNYPLRVMDHYTIGAAPARDFAALLSRQSKASLKRAVGLSEGRVTDMAVAALALEGVMDVMQPARLVFSGTGLREGLLYSRLTPAQKRQDPLLASCRKYALRLGRFDTQRPYDDLCAWMLPLYAGTDMVPARTVQAACLLSDAAGVVHEDFQAEQAFAQTLHLPYYGADHATRAFLALAQYVRYKGYLRQAPPKRVSDDVTAAAQRLLGPEQVHGAVVTGLALRAGWMLTGGALSLLRHTSLRLTPARLTLSCAPQAGMPDAAGCAQVMDRLAETLGRSFALRQEREA